MKIAVTSLNKVKISAVKRAFAAFEDVDVVGYATNSNTNEQPVGEEVLLGAKKRIEHLKEHITEFDYIISIENGIFFEDTSGTTKQQLLFMKQTGRSTPHTQNQSVSQQDTLSRQRKEGSIPPLSEKS